MERGCGGGRSRGALAEGEMEPGEERGLCRRGRQRAAAQEQREVKGRRPSAGVSALSAGQELMR